MIFRNWYLTILGISIISICSALVAEHFFSLQPCDLCLKQRHPYYFFIVLSLITLIFLGNYKYYISFLIQLGAIYGIFYAVWHVGVENKLLKGPAGCSANLNISSNANELKEQIFNKQVISCDEVTWNLLGMSAASINTIILLFIFIVNGLYIYNSHAQKEKL